MQIRRVCKTREKCAGNARYVLFAVLCVGFRENLVQTGWRLVQRVRDT